MCDWAYNQEEMTGAISGCRFMRPRLEAGASAAAIAQLR
jgi:hypothetical protein